MNKPKKATKEIRIPDKMARTPAKDHCWGNQAKSYKISKDSAHKRQLEVLKLIYGDKPVDGWKTVKAPHSEAEVKPGRGLDGIQEDGPLANGDSSSIEDDGLPGGHNK